MNQIIESIRKHGDELEQTKDEIISIESAVEKIREGKDYSALCEIKFSGMYSRSSKRFALGNEEVIDLLNCRLGPLYAKRDFLIKKLNSFL